MNTPRLPHHYIVSATLGYYPPLLLLASVAGCSPTSPTQEVEQWLEPGVQGPWNIGTRSDTIFGSDGLELTVQSWYPSSDTEGYPHAYGGIFEREQAWTGASPDCSQPRPVLAFSHGYTAINYQSIYLTEYLASQGWVIVAPDHRGNTLWDNVEHKITLALRRPIDIQDTVDWLFTDLAGPGGRLEGCVDPEAGYAISGHSFGGYTTLALAGAPVDLEAAMEYCAENRQWMCGDLEDWLASGGELGRHELGDDRIWAAIPMAHAGYEILFAGLPEVTIPTLVLGGGLDSGTTMEDQIQPAYDAMVSSKPRYLGELEQAGHFAFSDACEMLSGFAGDECEEPFIDPDDAHRVIQTWTTAFLQQVRGREDACQYLPGNTEGVRWQEILDD